MPLFPEQVGYGIVCVKTHILQMCESINMYDNILNTTMYACMCTSQYVCAHAHTHTHVCVCVHVNMPIGIHGRITLSSRHRFRR